MSNISPFGAKNPPWARGASTTSGTMVNQANTLQQQIITQNALGQMSATGMVQYQQPQVFQTQMGMQQQNLGLGISQLGNAAISVAGNLGSQMSANQLFSQVGAVTYPTPRSLNPNNFQNTSLSQEQSLQSGNNSSKQRVFTGTVTKVHDNFGFVDEDVFFQTSVCAKGSNPSVGDRVLVEASFNPNMPFKWNATRIQILPTTGTTTSRHSSSHNSKSTYSSSNSYNAVPPPSENSSGSYGSTSRATQRTKTISGRGRSRERSRDDDEIDRKRRREDRRTRERDEKEKKMSPPRRRSRSPKRSRRPIIVPRYMVHIPKIALDLSEADYLEIRRRYANLYVPSDFFCSYFRWVDAFPPNEPFSLNKPCAFHIMYKDVDSIVENTAVLEPPDADYLFSAKVMLLSMPPMQEIYQKCCSVAEDKDKRDRDSEERDFVHPTRLFNFLVGLRGKNETMALGGPWSPSLDGPDPDKNPSVLINTAIRTCKALTGIDLSTCTQWYRFVELYYRRGESTHKGKMIPARVETVVLFLPDVWSCVPTRIEWDSLHHSYKKKLEQKLYPEHQDPDSGTAADEKDDEDNNSTEEKHQPTHYSELDPKGMTVNELRKELKARNLNSKGLKSQLIARLTKTLKSEASEKNDNADDTDGDVIELDVSTSKTMDVDEKEEKKPPREEEKIDEKERLILEKRYTLPEAPHIIVHPSRTAKSGKFDCTVMSLSLLLDYRPEDTKEHSFEVSLFAELFNEMLMRDFGFYIFKALRAVPEKPKEDEKKKKDEDKDKDKDRDRDKKKDDVSNSKRKDKDDDKKKDDKEKSGKDIKKSSSSSTPSRKDDDESDGDDDDDDTDRKERKLSHSRSSRSCDRDREKRKRDRPKFITTDPYLLLSFVYFDQTHCGYIFEKDIEDLLFTLGLQLSRAQVRKIVSKVITRDSLHYRKLTDKCKDEIEAETSGSGDSTNDNKDNDDLVSGNKGLLPVFKTTTVPTTGKSLENQESSSKETTEGYITYQGSLLNVEKLMSQLKRIDKACSDTESRLVELKSENKKLQEKNTRANSVIKELTTDLKDYKEKLHITNVSLEKASACSKLFHSTLKDIKKQAELVINHKLYADSTSSESRSNNHESRWSEPDNTSTNTTKSGNTKHETEVKIKKENENEQKMESETTDTTKDAAANKKENV